MRRWIWLLAAAGLGVIVWLSGATPTISLNPPVKAVGTATPVKVRISSKNGIRYFRASVEQGGRSFTAMEMKTETARWKFWRMRQPLEQYEFVVGRKSISQLQDGPARLVLEAKSDDWRGSSAAMTVDISVRSRPPRLTVDGAQHYINQGGSEIVVFTTDPDVSDAGVRVGQYSFRSWRLPGGPPGSRFCIFAFPYDLAPEAAPVVYARDEAGNERTAGFWFRVFPKKFRVRRMELSDDFLRKVIQNIAPHAPQLSLTGDPVSDYLKINRELRAANNRELAGVRWKTEESFLWTKPFRQLANSQVEAAFADHRLYFYRGQKIDEADHLGFDLAVTANSRVAAANDGKVVFADYLGIYGNCVVIDHGYALQSIYGHLSSIGVKPGEMVRQGQEIGRSGSTGLAGGDHLHFSMQVDGEQVNATEWWDPHWIHDRILAKLPGGRLPVAGAPETATPAGAP